MAWVHLTALAEPLLEAGHRGEIGAGKAVDRLPVVPDRQEVATRLLQKTTDETGAGTAGVLELVDHHQVEGAVDVAGLEVVRRLHEHVLEVEDVVRAEATFPRRVDLPVDVEEQPAPEPLTSPQVVSRSCVPCRRCRSRFQATLAA